MNLFWQPIETFKNDTEGRAIFFVQSDRDDAAYPAGQHILDYNESHIGCYQEQPSFFKDGAKGNGWIWFESKTRNYPYIAWISHWMPLLDNPNLDNDNNNLRK